MPVDELPPRQPNEAEVAIHLRTSMNEHLTVKVQTCEGWGVLSLAVNAITNPKEGYQGVAVGLRKRDLITIREALNEIIEELPT